MRKLTLLCAALCATVCIFPAGRALAQARVWVAMPQSPFNGNDSTCKANVTDPCASFAQAISLAGAGGEVDCLTGGDYGPVTITASVTIDCGPGNLGVIEAVVNTSAITVNLSTAGTVILRNLSLNGFGAYNTIGINTTGFPNGSQLYVQHVSIQGFYQDAILFKTFGARGLMEVSDTTINNITSQAIQVVAESGSIASVVLDGVKITGAAGGITLNGDGTVAGVLRHSVVAECTFGGISASATNGVYFTIEESSVIDNVGNGIAAGASGVNLEVGASTIGGNGTGVNALAGSIYTFGNNQFSANGANGSFTPGGPGLQ
jgi:hypothetical protein